MNKKSAWSAGALFEGNPFGEGSFEWLNEPELDMNDEIGELAWEAIQNADVDAAHRRIIRDDGKRLSIDESVQRIHQQYPEFPLDPIETKVIVWLEGASAPERYSREQLDELDRLTAVWIHAHDRGRMMR